MKATELRQSILQAAVQGKLVPQNPKDEPASELLKQIQKEKVRLIHDGKIKKGKTLPPINEDETPYDLPEGWIWCRLTDIFDVRDGTHDTPKYVQHGIPLVTSKNLKKGSIDFSTAKFITEEDYIHIAMRSNVDEGDILFAMIGSIGNPVIVPDGLPKFGIKNMALFKYYNKELCNNGYLLIFLMFNESIMREISSGGVQSFVSLTFLRNHLFPMPPLAEQERIVAKSAHLLALCDELETTEIELDALEDRFVEYLPKTILQAAVQGKLMPQNPNDEPATELLKQIQQEKKHLVSDGKIKKEKPLSPISEDEIPYDLPDGWTWCRLGELGETNIGLTYKPANVSNVGIPVMRSNNIQDGKMNYDDIVFVKVDVPDKAILQKGDILICARNGSRRLVGKTAIVDRDGLAFGAFMAMFRSICNPYINVYLASPMFRANMDNPQTTTINQVTQEMLKNTLFPLPPFAEQKMIVAKADALLDLCDELKSAKTLSIPLELSNIIPFLQKSTNKIVADTGREIGMAARGDATQPLSQKLQDAIDDWDDEDE